MINEPYIQIEIGNIVNNNYHYIKKGTIVKKDEVFNQDNTPITYYDDGVHRSTDWTVLIEKPNFDYDKKTNMWTLDGLHKNQCYFCEIPIDALNWMDHLNDISVEITLKVDKNETLFKDGTTNNIAGFFNWKNLYVDSQENKPKWPNCQEYFKVDRSNNTYSFGYDTFDKSTIKLDNTNKLYYRYEIEPYRDFYSEEYDYDGDFLYPLGDDIRICRGWNTKLNQKGLEYVKRYVPSTELKELYKRKWNLKNCDRVYTKDGDKLRFKFFYDNNGNVFKKYSFKDFKIKVNIPYYTYYKNIFTMQDPSITITNNFFKPWSINNYQYSMFTRKTEKIGNQSIQNSGLKSSNRMSNMQRLWIALSGGKNLKDENGNDFYLIIDDDKFGRDKLINILSPIQQLLWTSWHLENTNGTWKNYIQKNFENGNLNNNHINIFLTRFVWLWQTIFDIMPVSQNNLNTDEPPSDLLGGSVNNAKTYYNKRYFYKIIKELVGWPMSISKSLSTILYNWITPKYSLKLNNDTTLLDIHSSFVNKNNSAELLSEHLEDVDFFYTIPSYTTFIPNRFKGYTGDYYNNHAINFITTNNFVNNINYERVNNGWFSPDGYLKQNSIPILGKNNNNSRLESDSKYMYRISDKASENLIRGIYTSTNNKILNGTKSKHGGLVIKLPEYISKYSIPWKESGYVPKITNIEIEVEFSIRQLDENNDMNSYPISNILSTHPTKSLLYFKSSSKKVFKSGSANNAWKNSGMWYAAPELIDYNLINGLNISPNNETELVEENSQIVDNGVYKIIYIIDNLPKVKQGNNYTIDPLKSAVLLQIDYTKTDTQKELGVKTIRSDKNENYNGENGKPNYSFSPEQVNDLFKNDGDFSFSVHKKNLYGLESNENTKKHLGIYLFNGEYSQSSYYFKNINVKLTIPELELENAIKQSEVNKDIDSLSNEIVKAENTFKGVIDESVINKAKNKLSFLKINKSLDLTNIETNEINIKNVENILSDLEKLTLNINSEEFDRKIELENIYNFMIVHNNFKTFDRSTTNIKKLNDMLNFIKTKNIVEKYKNNNQVLTRNVSLQDKLDLSVETKLFSDKIKTLIDEYMKTLDQSIKEVSQYKVGDGKISKYILLIDKLAVEGFNDNLYSNILVNPYNKTPIQMMNESSIKLNSIVSNEIGVINDLVANSNKNQNTHLLIKYLLDMRIENKNNFLEKTTTLNDQFLFGERHVKNIIIAIIDSWNTIFNSQDWNAKEYGFNWLSDKTRDVNKKSFTIDIFNIEIIQNFVDNVIRNLDLKIKDIYSLNLNVYNKNKGRISEKTVFDFPIDPYLFVEETTLTNRGSWKENIYIKSFLDEVWIGKTDKNIVKNTNKFGQIEPWKTPLGALSKRIMDNSESFLKLSVSTKNGFPNKDKWYYPGISGVPINFYKEGTISYPNRNWEKFNSILRKPQDINNSIALPPGPFTNLKNFLEKTINIYPNHYSYKIKKDDFYHKSIWLYEYGLKFDTRDNESIYRWIDLTKRHGLPEDNPQLILVKKKLKTKNKTSIVKLKDLYDKVSVEFKNNNYISMQTAKKELLDVSNNYLQTDIIEYKKLNDLVLETEIVLKDRLILFVESAIDYSFYGILENVVEQVKTSKLHISGNKEIINAYNNAKIKLQELEQQNKLELIEIEKIKQQKKLEIEKKIKESMEKIKSEKTIESIETKKDITNNNNDDVLEIVGTTSNQPTIQQTITLEPTTTVVEPNVVETQSSSRISQEIKQQTKQNIKKELNYNVLHNRFSMFSFNRNIHHSIKNNRNYQQSVKEANTGSMGRLVRLKQINKR